MKPILIERVIQVIAAIVSLPFNFAFQAVGVFVNDCYTGFMAGWQQPEIKRDKE